MNILELSKTLHNRINLATTPEEIYILSKVREKLNVGSVKTVTTFSDLIKEFAITGEVYFVENEQRLYFSSGSQWNPINNIPLRTTWSWGGGSAYDGRLGVGFTGRVSSPISVLGGFTNWIDLDCGRYHAVGIRSTGTAWVWGRGDQGRLGDGTTNTATSPISVVGGFTDWSRVSGGNQHSAGVRLNGTLWTWGGASGGVLGDNTTVSKSSPVSVVGGFTDWVDVSCSFSHNLGLRGNGTIWTWGYNNLGQLGDNSITNRSSPVSVVGGITNWVNMDAGNYSSHAIRANGTLWSWGRNNYGQLGDGTVTSRRSPVSVVGGFTDWVQVSGGNIHTAAVRANGTLWCWGAGTNGRLGTNSTTNTSSPVSVVGGFTDWVQVGSGTYSTIGIRSNGTAWGWGANSYGQLGDGTTTSRSSPVSVVGGITGWVAITAGATHNVAIRSQ